ncbi:hypothetical protein HRR83_003594 [Exophiala dermatitidis]|uniref:Hydantoinase n=2 Tax=Exophiala dermatitidis TaxID=5970 RepID=H6BSN5_EXODN|nr:uncharacterized protein HMPREF1120_01581 [Exophiala dermatitidis NIH/UT8656]KAJ4522441.1 hypothetical protein HRR74_003026 [Exophiala dermatitidis]EHY53387.1 hypothetical protein HMPREF1120_01581 [Exophiala dermatitidis NIH/UT8656]KAJ4529766.1 hypothetical protein HRR73_000794 [Exophiala dermatitidis]KAJ4543067.1 hypothetical protein HRR77_005327 [Exophiala dermatitidis]KAJ4543568.1 hypothetical protein HRR76_001635 [Exophiala dermatitidis]
MPGNGSYVVGVDVGGTNTDSVLVDVSKTGPAAVLSSHKAATTSNVTLSVRETLKILLDESPVDRKHVSAIAIGTTHFINAIIERDSSRVEKVAVLRLASHNFSAGTPPFVDWPSGLKRIVHGHAAIIPGGCNIDGSLIADIDEAAVREQARTIKAKGLRNVVIVGIGSPTDHQYHQEERARDILRAVLHNDVNIVCSRDVAGNGLLARENAAILNASILNFASRAIRAFMAAMSHVGLQCPLYLTSNKGHLLTFSEAMQFPIRIFSSGATNSIRGAAVLLGSDIGQSGSVVVDIGGTTTEVGYLLKNGYPRLSKSYTDLAGIKVNLEMPSVESVGLGGGSIAHVSSDEKQVLVGPDSVGHDLLTRALCFGGSDMTATDIVVASGDVSIGTTPVELRPSIIAKARARMKKMLEACIDRAKSSPEPCTVVLVGGGSILCPQELNAVEKIVVPQHAGVANAIGAAMAKISGSAELIIQGSDIQQGIARVKSQAIENGISRGGNPASVTILNEEVVGVPYAQNQTRIKVEVAMPADHERVRKEMSQLSSTENTEVESEMYEDTKKHEAWSNGESSESEHVDVSTYRPRVTENGIWMLSELDLRFLSIGCYILGVGGGGSPYAVFLQLKQLLSEGEAITIMSFEDLKDDDQIPTVAGVGSPAVSVERPGGDGIVHALKMLSEELHTNFTQLSTAEIGGGNGLQPLVCGSSKYFNLPTVDGDLMGRAYPGFENCSTYVMSESINALLPVTLCSGTGHNVLIPAGQTDEKAPGIMIRDACFAMGSACGAAGVPLSGKQMRTMGIPNTHSLAWRLGRVVFQAQQSASLASLPEALIKECGGDQTARRLFQGKIRSVESALTTTAHSLGKVTIEALGEDETESEADKRGSWTEVVIPFMNENLAVLGKNGRGEETVLATVPDLIFLLDVSTGENIGVQEYRYGLKVTVMIMAPHPIWTTKRGLEVGGPSAFNLPYEYNSTLKYTKPRSVIEEFRPKAAN